jgi:hypothetical protein
MSARIHTGEYDTEPIRGLPEYPPDGEEILWQGSPDWRGLARRAFHVRKIALYFALLVLWRVATAISSGERMQDAVIPLTVLTTLALAALAFLTGMAWLNSRTTVYTITNRRVVMRFGVALTMAINLPFRQIQSAELKAFGDGTGDLALSIRGVERIGYMMMWPHVRPWRMGTKLEPMLRSLPDGNAVAELLARAVTAAATAERPSTRTWEAAPASARPLPVAAAAS